MSKGQNGSFSFKQQLREKALFFGLGLFVLMLFVAFQNFTPIGSSKKNGRFNGKALRSTPEIIPHKLVVKYKDTVDEALEFHSGASGRLKKATGRLQEGVSLDGLENLHRKFGVRSFEPVFRESLTRTTGSKARRAASASVSDLKAMEVLKFEGTKSRNSKAARAERSKSRIPMPFLHHVYVLDVDSSLDSKDLVAAAEEISKDPNVEYAQPLYKMEPQFIPNDPYYTSQGSWGQAPTSPDYKDQWSLRKFDTDRNGVPDMEQLWDITQGLYTQGPDQGKPVIVAVNDTGVDYTHPDLAENIWINPGEIPDNGIDDDGNGYIDDVRGYDFADSDNDPMDDLIGHGTHVAGTIAAVGNNNQGIVGVAPKAKIMIVKGFTSGDGSGLGLLQGMRYAADNGAKIINNSWGCYKCPANPIYTDAMSYATAKGVALVFSAGNNTDNSFNDYPQNSLNPKPIVVSASTGNDVLTYFSNYGFSVDVAAPGGGEDYSETIHQVVRNILSLRSSRVPDQLDQDRPYVRDGVWRQAGTSMSAPFVSGVAALIIAANPGVTPEQIRMRLRATATPMKAPSGLYPATGLVNPLKAVTVQGLGTVKITASGVHPFRNRGRAPFPIRLSASKPYKLYIGAENIPTVWNLVSQGPAGTNIPFDLTKTMPFWKETVSGTHLMKIVIDEGLPTEVSDVLALFAESNVMRIDDFNESVEIAHNEAINIGENDADFSGAFWFFLEDDFSGVPRQIINKGNNTNERLFSLNLNAFDNAIQFRITTSTGAVKIATSNKKIPLKKWTHLAYVKAGRTVTLYIDGVADKVINLKADELVASNTGPLVIGNDLRIPAWPFVGRVDELMLFKKALTMGDIGVLMISTPDIISPVSETGLALFMPFDMKEDFLKDISQNEAVNVVTENPKEKPGSVQKFFRDESRYDPELRMTSPTVGSRLTTSSVTFTWTAVPNATNYDLRIWRGPSTLFQGAFTVNKSLNPPAIPTYTLNNLVLDGTPINISLRVRLNGLWYRRLFSYSTNQSLELAPLATLTGAGVPGKNQVELKWTYKPGTVTPDGFQIERSQSSNGPFNVVGSVAANATSFIDSGLFYSTAYFYRIFAFKAGVPNSGNATISVVTPPFVSPVGPEAPVVSLIPLTGKRIQLNWFSNAVNPTYYIERSVNNGAFSALTNLKSTFYIDSNLTAGSTYSYRIYYIVTSSGLKSAVSEVKSEVALP